VIVDLSPLVLCSRLAALDLSNHAGIEDLAPLNTLVGLKELRLQQCSFLSMDPLLGLALMTRLDIMGNAATSLQLLMSLTQLVELDLSDCGEITSLEHITALTSLTGLHIGSCHLLTSLDPLSSLT
jgi:hypothetical protein